MVEQDKIDREIDLAWLRAHGACEPQVRIVAQNIGESGLTVRELLAAANLGLDLDWLGYNLFRRHRRLLREYCRRRRRAIRACFKEVDRMLGSSFPIGATLSTVQFNLSHAIAKVIRELLEERFKQEDQAANPPSR